MAESRDRHDPPRLGGYESWLYRMPRLGSEGDVFVCIPCADVEDVLGEPANRWLIALGDVAGGVFASRLKAGVEAEVVRMVGPGSDPTSLLGALNVGLMDLIGESFATMMVAVIDGDRHELSVASAGSLPLLLRRSNGRIEAVGEDVCGLPLGIERGQTYETVAVPIRPGDVVVFHSDGVTEIIDHEDNAFDRNALEKAIDQASSTAAAVGQRILEAVRRFSGGRPQPADMTLLCLGRTA
jgi:sigma-B regulation protein RsbU (phosphoserine phosphatase)